MKKLSYVYVFIILFLFIPFCLSASTYYDWERIEVSSLPVADEENMNKVYIKDGHYYVVKLNVGGVTPIPLGHSSSVGDSMYISFPSDIFDLDIYKNLFNFSELSNGIYVNNFIMIRGINETQFSLQIYCDLGSTCGFYTIDSNHLNHNYSVFRDYVFPDTFEVSIFGKSWLSVPQEFSDFANYVYNHISITPLENTYEWIEVDKYDVKEIKLDDRDFYLFYSFDDIKEFNILSNYDLDSFSDFQKIVVCLGGVSIDI